MRRVLTAQQQQHQRHYYQCGDVIRWEVSSAAAAAAVVAASRRVSTMSVNQGPNVHIILGTTGFCSNGFSIRHHPPVPQQRLHMKQPSGTVLGLFRSLTRSVLVPEWRKLGPSWLRENRNHHQQYTSTMIAIRHMGGGPRNEEHKERLRALRKARKLYFDSLPERPTKKHTRSTRHFDELMKWRLEPTSVRIKHRVKHICSFIIYSWLQAYPLGATIRKLQRDIAFRMERKHRLPEKMPYQAIMPIVGKLERENYLSIRMKSNGHVLIYRDNDVNIVPKEQTDMPPIWKDGGENYEKDDDGVNDASDQDDEWYHKSLPPNEEANVDVESDKDRTVLSGTSAVAHENTEIDEDQTMLSGPIPIPQIPYKPYNHRPKFAKESKPKVRKVKQRKVKDRSNPVLDPVKVPPGTIPTSRGPRYVILNDTTPSTMSANSTTMPK